MIRVGVVGARGRMGREVCRAIAAAKDLELVAAVDRSPGAPVEGLDMSADPEVLQDRGAEVAVGFTHRDAVLGYASLCLTRGIHLVDGTTGMAGAELDTLRELAESGDANAIVAPNFAVGAVLMMRFAQEAARHLDAAEVIELHHDGKADAPSGTALTTARMIARARRGDWTAPGGDEAHPGARGADVDGVRVHGVRLPGLLAHQEVLFGGPGQALSIRHDTTDRAAFMPGVLLAVRQVATRPGLTIGLDALLD